MLVYANHLQFRGKGAEEAIFRAVGGWFKEQLGFGLRPDQLRSDGQFKGTKGDTRSWLRVRATESEEPRFYAWDLSTFDSIVQGRRWVTELGLKAYEQTYEISCVLKTDERSALIDDPVKASRPRVIPYLVANIREANDAAFDPNTLGLSFKNVGSDRDSYRSLLTEIERKNRDSPVVLVSPTRQGEYLVDAQRLQEDLVGLAQVVQVVSEFNSYEMEEVLGQRWSAWDGAVNIIHTPTQAGYVRGRYFLSDEISSWGKTQNTRICELLAWVTNNTNMSRLRNRIRVEGVVQLATRRRMQGVRIRSAEMDADQLRAELEEAERQVEGQASYFDEIVSENSMLEASLLDIRADIAELQDGVRRKDFEIQSLKGQLESAGQGRTSSVDGERLLGLASRKSPPTPFECISAIEGLYGDRCIFLDSARQSAKEMNGFAGGRQLLDMLHRLVSEYRDALIEGGDALARRVFSSNEYAAKESETVMQNKGMSRARTFEYLGEPTEMFRHLKIGVDDDVTKTIRVYFYWDANIQKIIVGYCGKHLPVASH